MVKLALVGCGGMAHAHAQNLQKIPDARVVALCDIVPAHSAQFRERYFNDAREFESFDRMLHEMGGALDGVILVTPHTVHYGHAKAALERGLHVLTEKPMVTSSEHAYDLWRTVKRTGKLLGIAFQSSYSAEFAYLAQARDRGDLGKVQTISGYLSQNWLTFTQGKWRQDPALAGGGFMYDSGAHLLNAIMWLMNEPVVEVCCMYDTCGSPVDINGVATMRFESGAFGSVAMSGNCLPFRNELQIMTDRMVILIDQYGGKLEMYGQRRIYPHVQQQLDVPAAGTPQLNFINAIKGSEPLRAPVRYGVLLSALMDAMYESHAKRAPVQVKPVPKDIDV